MSPAIDVVIPTLNAASTLPRTIAALEANHLGSLSVIVCDGGSHDDTVAIAHRSDARIVCSPAGRGRQLAAGAEAGSAPWLLFLHADSIPGDDWRETVLRFVTEPANAQRAGYFRLRFDSPDPRARRVERLVAWRCRKLGLPYGDQGLLMARTLYDRLGGFLPLPLMEDVEFVRRIGRQRLMPLDAEIVTSACRYERDGWISRPARNLSCLALFFAGIPVPIIRRLYGA